MEALKSSRYNQLLFEIVNGEKLRVEISREALARVKNKNYVYSGYSHLLPLFEEDISVKPVSRYVYFNFKDQSEPLDIVRLNMGRANLDEEREIREKVIRGLISLYYLVATGKIYNIPINPLNYVMYRDKVMGFYRYDEELGEITDEWMLALKKLLAFYLVTDSSVIPERYEEYTIAELINYMPAGVKRGFQVLYNCVSVEEMLEVYVPERSDIKALKNFFPLDMDFKEPLDLTSDSPPIDFDTVVANTVPSDEPLDFSDNTLLEKSSKKGKFSGNKIKKQKVSDKEKEQDKIKKKKELEKKKLQKSKKIKNTYEPNELKRRANEPTYKGLQAVRVPRLLGIVLMVIAIAFGIYFGFKTKGIDIIDELKNPQSEEVHDYSEFDNPVDVESDTTVETPDEDTETVE